MKALMEDKPLPERSEPAWRLMDAIRFGDLELMRIEEQSAPMRHAAEMFPDLPSDALATYAEPLRPLFLSAGDLVAVSTHAWLLRTPGVTVLIEPCAGNHKHRPGFARGHQLEGPWKRRLLSTGVAVDGIDFVFCSHLHPDHVGWSTQLRDGRWVPTFPRARYVFARAEYDNWNPATRTLPSFPDNEGVFEDSVLPVVEAGQALLVDDGYEIAAGLTLRLAPGHTLGHSWLEVQTADRTIVFCGDTVHSPLQFVFPHCNTWACEDPAAAPVSRRKLLAEASEHGHLLFPAHFPSPEPAAFAEPSGDGFKAIGLLGNVILEP